MRKWFRGRKQLRHALIIKDHVIRYVQCRGPQLDQIERLEERYLPQGIIDKGKMVERETVSMIVKECVERWGIARAAVQFCVPDAFVTIRSHHVDGNVPDDEIKGELYLSLGETLHLPFDDPIFDYKVLDTKARQKQVLLVAAPESMIMEYEELLREVSLKPIAFDLTSLCLYRLAEAYEQIQRDDHVLFLQYDITAYNVTIFHREIPVFTRHFQIELDRREWKQLPDAKGYHFSGEQRGLEVEFDQVLNELERMITFYQFSVQKGQTGVDALYIFGDFPYLEQFFERLEKRIDLSCQFMKPVQTECGSIDVVPLRFYENLGLVLKKEVQEWR
ncbi:type IV pilus biogenesis protein PilM [Halalkalibacterium ligniniphilum]|uniref:type IV pilus biogenesis protein PilM n=1 Tax=Halalkalibacterium ligniniphilum TaxID=1134413 RepID=UPI000349044C|nr:pilus assembly protein PilM [Halalkalibacterium ligniniphilum]